MPLLCEDCTSTIDRHDKYCRECGNRLVATSQTTGMRSFLQRQCTQPLFLLLLFAIVALVASTDNDNNADNADYGKNAGMWHTVGELFNREQQRQRKMKHSSADQVENGPKEISIFCPQDPTIRIMDLSEDERDRDECLVLNIAAPDVSSRLVLFCNAHPLEDSGKEDDDEEKRDDTDIPSEEL